MNEYDKRVAKALELARSKAGISQERLAKRMGVSRPTIAGKEQGTSPTSLADIINWCVSCGVPAKRYTDACVHPGLLEYLEDGIGAEEKRQILHGLVDDMSNYEVDGWLYLYYGDHGSDPLGVLTEVLANLHTPLRDRVTIVNAIIGHYKMAQSTDTDPDPNGVQPVMPIVQQASQCGTEAARRGSDVYSAQLEVDKDGKG